MVDGLFLEVSSISSMFFSVIPMNVHSTMAFVLVFFVTIGTSIDNGLPVFQVYMAGERPGGREGFFAGVAKWGSIHAHTTHMLAYFRCIFFEFFFVVCFLD